MHARFEAIHPQANGNSGVEHRIVHTLLRADDLTTRTTVPVVTVVLNEANGYVGNALPK